MRDASRHGLQAQAGDLNVAAEEQVLVRLGIEFACGRDITKVEVADRDQIQVAPRAAVHAREAGHTAPGVGANQVGILVLHVIRTPRQVTVDAQLPRRL